MKSPYFSVFLSLCLLLSQVHGQFPAERLLTDATGRTLDATVLSANGERIRIRRKSDGKEFDLPLVKLSAADRLWLEILMKPGIIPQTDQPKEEPLPERLLPKPTPKPAVHEPPKPLSDKEILAEQAARGMVLPPEGRHALQTTIIFKDGRVIHGYVYNLEGNDFWYADQDLIQKKASLYDLGAISRFTVEKWKTQSSQAISPSIKFVLNGAEIHASVLHVENGQVTLLKESGELLENLPMSELDDTGRRFVAVWNAGKWKPSRWEWVIPADFTAVTPFSESGHAFLKKDDKWGVIDFRGEWVMPARFDHVKKFSDSAHFKVRENDKTGLVSGDGRLLLPPAWEDVGDLHYGLIPVCLKGKWGYAEESGKLVIPCTWDAAWRFTSAGTAVVTLNFQRGFIDRNGKVIVRPEWDGALGHTPEGIGAVRRGKGWALVDDQGKLLCEPIWNLRWKERRFELGYIPAWPVNGSINHRIFLGVDGRPGATPRLREGVCLPALDHRNSRSWEKSDTFLRQFPYTRVENIAPKKGLMDLNGRIVFQPKYDDVVYIDRETYFLKSGGSGQVSDVRGKAHLEGKISSARVLENGSGYEVVLNDKRSAYWKDWQPVLAQDWESFIFIDCYGEDLIFREDVGNAATWWRADFTTRKLHRFEGASRVYWVKSLADYNRIWLEDAQTKRWHFSTSDGNRLGLEMERQPESWFFDEGFGVMWEGAKCYFVDKEGKRLDYGLWDDAGVFKNGLVAVKKDGLWGFMDASGKIVTGCEYDEVGNFFVASVKEEAKGPLLAAVCKAGKWGYLNDQGKLVIPLVGDRKGDWQAHWKRSVDGEGVIYLYSQDRATGSFYWDANGNKVDKFLENTHRSGKRSPFAGKWEITRNPNGLIGLASDSGLVALEQEWCAIEWVAPQIVAVRGEHAGGLFSVEDGWLFRDDSQCRIQRQRGNSRGEDRLDIGLHEEGFIRIEQTPRWGFARWKNTIPKDG